MIVVGKKVKPGKVQHLRIGQEYEVSQKDGEMMIKNGQAEKKGAKKKSTKKKVEKD